MINVCKLYYTLEKKNRGVKRINGEVFLVLVLVLRFVCVCVCVGALPRREFILQRTSSHGPNGRAGRLMALFVGTTFTTSTDLFSL